jgi:hypothetical protein
MQSTAVNRFLSTIQDNVYRRLNNYSYNPYQSLGKTLKTQALAITIAAIDVTLETIKTPLGVIEHVIATIMHMIGVIFADPKHYAMYQYQRYSAKSVLWHFDRSLGSASFTPVALLVSPLKLFYQLFFSMSDPAKAESINTIYRGSHIY